VRDGKTGATRARRPGFANNAFIFPGVALGSLASGASKVTDKMFLAAALALASLVTEEDLEKGAVYPPTSTIREAAFFVGAGVAAAAAEEFVARPGACAGGAIPVAGGKAVPSLDAAPGENENACVNWEACVRDYAKTCL
jgi:malate dehydrogenase (oxaloacetate-decarboxylating)(NADP+)